jgi:hypothetical protein
MYSISSIKGHALLNDAKRELDVSENGIIAAPRSML